MATYGGYQRGNERIEIDPLTGEQIIVSDDLEVSPGTRHEYGPWTGFIAPRKTNIGTFASMAALAADPFIGGGAGASTAPALNTITPTAAGTIPVGAGAAPVAASATAPVVGATVPTVPIAAGAAAGSGLLPRILDAAGQGLTAIGSAQDQNRAARADQGRYEDDYNLSRAELEMRQREFGQREGQINRRNALAGGLLEGIEDISFDRPAGIPSRGPSGGLRPSAILNRDELGAFIREQAMRDLVNPKPFTELGPASAYPGGGGTAAGLGSLGLSLLGNLLRPQQPRYSTGGSTATTGGRNSLYGASFY